MFPNEIPDSAFPPGRLEPCFCGSGERFKLCCGSKSSNRMPPKGIQLVENFLTKDECDSLVSLIEQHESEPFKVRDPNNNMEVQLDPSRVCSWAKMDDNQFVLDDLVAKAFADKILPYEKVSIDWYEQPQLLSYTPGGFYWYHSDSSDLNSEKNTWFKAVDRDISLLIYLTGDFEGGELEFKNFSYFLKPKAGMLVWFPSDMRYVHMAHPVKQGKRYAVVSWASVSGIEKVQKELKKRPIYWSEKMQSTEPGEPE